MIWWTVWQQLKRTKYHSKEEYYWAGIKATIKQCNGIETDIERELVKFVFKSEEDLEAEQDALDDEFFAVGEAMMKRKQEKR